jgi:hypothetical protein
MDSFMCPQLHKLLARNGNDHMTECNRAKWKPSQWRTARRVVVAQGNFQRIGCALDSASAKENDSSKDKPNE